ALPLLPFEINAVLVRSTFLVGAPTRTDSLATTLLFLGGFLLALLGFARCLAVALFRGCVGTTLASQFEVGVLLVRLDDLGVQLLELAGIDCVVRRVEGLQ